MKLTLVMTYDSEDNYRLFDEDGGVVAEYGEPGACAEATRTLTLHLDFPAISAPEVRVRVPETPADENITVTAQVD